MRAIKTQVTEEHPDYPILSALRDEIVTRAGGIEALTERFPEIIRDALDFVLDSVRTAQTRLCELDNVEKSFIGLKVEHFIRDLLDLPKGLRDLQINGIDVDIKNTVNENWSIPQETYRNSEPCLLTAIDEPKHLCSLGLIIAKPEYLHGGKGNRDTKKGVLAEGFKNILWLVKEAPFRQTRFKELDMDRFRELRKTLKGNKRVAQFCRENIRRVVHRDVIQALLFEQHDYMKRLRAKGGAPDTLKYEKIAILVGTYRAARKHAAQLGFPDLKRDEIVAVTPRTPQDEQYMLERKLIV